MSLELQARFWTHRSRQIGDDPYTKRLHFTEATQIFTDNICPECKSDMKYLKSAKWYACDTCKHWVQLVGKPENDMRKTWTRQAP